MDTVSVFLVLEHRKAAYQRMFDTAMVRKSKEAKDHFDPTIIDAHILSQDYQVAAKDLHKFAERFFLQASACRAKLKSVQMTIAGNHTQDVDLSPVDYERLKISNESFKGQLLDTLDDVAGLKVEVGRRTKSMGKTREKVEAEEVLNIQLCARLAEREAAFIQIAGEKARTGESIAVLETSKANLAQRLEQHRAPSILEFAQQLN
jgi:hypothetical protein